MRRALALAVACGCLVLPSGATASALPAGSLFGIECVKSSGDSHPCEVSLSPALGDVGAVAVSPNGRFVWAGGADGVVWTFRRGAQGRLAPVEPIDLPDLVALAPSPDGRDLYAVGGSGRLHRLTVGSDGRLGDGGCFDQGSGCGVDNTVPALANAADVTVSGDGENVYVAAGSGTDAISVFTRKADGSLSYEGCIGATGAICSRTAAGLEGAHGVDVSPQGGSVYVAATGPTFGGSFDGAVVALERHSDGSLEDNGCVGGADSAAACGATGLGMVDPYEVETSTNALYLASRDGLDGSRSTVGRLVRGNGGTLSFGACWALTGSSVCGAFLATPGISNPSDLTLAPDGTTLQVSALGGTVTSFRRSSNGVVVPSGCLAKLDSTEACTRTRLIESTAEAIDAAPDGANVYVGTAAGLAVLGREVAPVCRNASAVVPGTAAPLPLPCFDLNGDPLARLPVAGPAHGEIDEVNDAAGSVGYSPEPGYVGPDFLTFYARGGSLRSNTARVAIDVTNRRPRLTRVRLTRRRFRRGRKRPRLARRRRAKIGTRIRFRLSEPARVTLSFERKRGRRRYRKVRTRVRVRADTGRNAILFYGRLSRRRRLKPGSYRLTIVARDPQGLRSRRRRVTFKLLR